MSDTTSYQAEFARLDVDQYGPKAFFVKKGGGTYGLGISQLPDKGQGLVPGTKYTIYRDGWELTQYHEARQGEYPSTRPREEPPRPAGATNSPKPRPPYQFDAACLTGLAKSLVEAKTVTEPEDLARWLRAFNTALKAISDEPY